MAYTVYVPEAEQIIAQVNAITHKHFSKVLLNLVYEKSPTLARLQAKSQIKIKGGSKIAWPVRVEKLATADFVDPRAALTRATNDTRVGAELNWKFGMADTFMHWDEIVKNKNSKSMIIDLIADKLTELKEDWEDLFATALFAASPAAEDMESLISCIGITEYAGIDPDVDITDDTRWKSILEATPNSDLGIYDSDVTTGTSLYSLINQATFGKQRPTVIIVSRARFDYLDEVGGDKVRITDKLSFQLGFDNIKLKGIPVLADPFCPDDMVFGIDEDALELIVHPDWDNKLSEWENSHDYPNTLFKSLSWSGNTKLKRRHTSFRISDLVSL